MERLLPLGKEADSSGMTAQALSCQEYFTKPYSIMPE